MLVTDDSLVAGRDLIELCRAGERGGVTVVELRLKQASGRALTELARALVGALHLPVILNDRADVALAAGARGVHIGPEDLPVGLARRVLPYHAIIGASVGSEQEATQAGSADYWGIGPWRATATKPDAGAALGRTGFAALVRQSGGRPCIAIGGVTPEDVPQVLAAGGVGVAVASGILGTDDVEAAARRYAGAWR